MLLLKDFPAPSLRISPECDVVFRLAFAESQPHCPTKIPSLDRWLELAQRTGLLSRVGWQLGRSGVDFDKALAAPARRAYRGVATQHLILTHALGAVGAALDRASVSWTVLKFGAMAISGVVEPGQRGAGDLDILIAKKDLRRGVAALAAIGFAAKGGREAEHQLDPLASTTLGVCVEPHKVMLGVRLPGSNRSLDQERLIQHRLVSPAPPDFRSGYVPRVGVLLAHTVIHGLLHHGFRPCEYPLFRMVADVIDLTEAGRTREALHQAFIFLKGDIDAGVIDELADLCEALRAGELASKIVARDDSRGSRLLKHLLAASLSNDYSNSLEFLHAKHRLSDHSFAVSRGLVLLDRIVLTRSEAEKVTGKKLSPLGYARVLAKRPRYIWTRLRKSFSGPHPNSEPIPC